MAGLSEESCVWDYTTTWYCKCCGRFCANCCGRSCAACCVQGQESSPGDWAPSRLGTAASHLDKVSGESPQLSYWHKGKKAYIPDYDRILRVPPLRKVFTGYGYTDPDVKLMAHAAWSWEEPRYDFDMQVAITNPSSTQGMDLPVKAPRDENVYSLAAELPPLSYHLSLCRDTPYCLIHLPVHPQ
ncbi:hypothetical protein C0Q70_04435 [Pomacea canaliculata]|uniref:Uncharacterized protein n=1 Tax=Pomacea canaliculata TaxID=400727 RepID=A0A2T7PID4_POMCA|nr:uncharacterized protein LOC112560765 isoform X2 [Pomacea canaliculata]PVD33185.1 hypothetical protein C0Q70_04435 [Pomacea canaliculata]